MEGRIVTNDLVNCPRCGGLGIGAQLGTRCSTCRGTGVVARAEAPGCDHKFVGSNVCLKCGWKP